MLLLSLMQLGTSWLVFMLYKQLFIALSLRFIQIVFRKMLLESDMNERANKNGNKNCFLH